MALIRIPHKPGIPKRYQRLIPLLEERPHTATELAKTLGIERPSTILSYLCELAKYLDIQVEGPYGDTRYSIHTKISLK